MSRLALALALSASLAASACVDGGSDASMVILRNLAPGDGCVLDPSSDVAFTNGVIQIDSSAGYLFTPLVRNDLVTVEGEIVTRKTIFVEGARVTIDFYDTTLFTADEIATFQAEGLTRFQAPTSSSISPNGGTHSFNFEIVPPELLAELDAKLPLDARSTVLNVSVQMVGYINGDEITSNVFRYPVEVCRDCLVTNVGACAGIDPGVDYPTGGACNPVQDGTLACCTATDGSLVCPATPPPSN